jgi:hypothetical protein
MPSENVVNKIMKPKITKEKMNYHSHGPCFSNQDYRCHHPFI